MILITLFLKWKDIAFRFKCSSGGGDSCKKKPLPRKRTACTGYDITITFVYTIGRIELTVILNRSAQ
jgi:hypothetical protein